VSGAPLDRWADDEALREFARLARDLPDVDADEAWRRLERLTAEQPRRGCRSLPQRGSFDGPTLNLRDQVRRRLKFGWLVLREAAPLGRWTCSRR
jgi:hypothetical protein